METFENRSKEFTNKLEYLCQRYFVQVSANIQPVNWLAKWLKKFIKVKWKLIIVDMAKPTSRVV